MAQCAVDVAQDRLDLARSLGVPETYNAAQTGRDELVEMLGASEMGGAKLELEDANTLIMSARVKAHWFDDDEAVAPAEKE